MAKKKQFNEEEVMKPVEEVMEPVVEVDLKVQI